MPAILKYGVNSALQLDIPATTLLANCEAPRGAPVEDVVGELQRRLDSPLNFPPFKQAIVPGDKVVLALDQGVPQAGAIVAKVVGQLVDAGANAGDITIIRTLADVEAGAPDPRRQLASELRKHVALGTHDPFSRDQLSYLAASNEGDPIYVNRHIHSADIVVPIGCLQLDESLVFHGGSAGIFPAFSDAKSQRRYRSPKSAESAAARRRLWHQSDRVSWLLGISFTIQIVPGAGEDVLHVLAGEASAVREQGAELCRQAWSYAVPRRASLVVASIQGDPSRQTWENVARALAAASRAVADDGAIALCTDLDTGLGPGLEQIAAADDRHQALRQIIREHTSDVLPASQLVRALERTRVYLLSRLDEATVEQLGVAAVNDADEIARLARVHDSCILLANAQYALATPADESGDECVGPVEEL